VIAEGVETARQAAIMAELGCGHAQGHWFERAVAPTAFEHLLARRPRD
jgi:EAL domain-containing protein (putative c-di-GMP-specific phosphodiesterase class I)